MHPRSIIHLNVADFAVAVEQQVDRRLQNRPVIVAPYGAARTAVYDMSEEAYRQGVRKGMDLRRAFRYCRDAIVLPPHPDRYERAMSRLLKQVLPYSPLVETADRNGHLFVDLTGSGKLFGPPQDVAFRIRKQVRADMGLDPIWSLAANKLVAKVATRLVKPSGEYIVRPGDEAVFLKPVPIHLIPGIDRTDLQQLLTFNITVAGQVAALTRDQMDVLFGNQGRMLYEAVRGIDASPVLSVRQKQPKVSADYWFGEDTTDVAQVDGVLYTLVEQVGKDLRQQRRAARRVGIILDYSDGKRTIRQASANPPADNDYFLFSTAGLALKRAWTRRVRIRHIRLVCDRLTWPSAQPDLFSQSREDRLKKDRLITTLDTIRQKFGADAVKVGRTFKS